MYVRRATLLGDAASDAQDSSVAAQQHALAIAAYNAKQAGNFTAYSQAIQGLYALGFENVSDADLQAMLDIATTPPANPFAGLTTALMWGGILVGGFVLLQSGILKRFAGKRRGTA